MNELKLSIIFVLWVVVVFFAAVKYPLFALFTALFGVGVIATAVKVRGR